MEVYINSSLHTHNALCYQLTYYQAFPLLWNHCCSWGINVRGFRGLYLLMNLQTCSKLMNCLTLNTMKQLSTKFFFSNKPAKYWYSTNIAPCKWFHSTCPSPMFTHNALYCQMNTQHSLPFPVSHGPFLGLLQGGFQGLGSLHRGPQTFLQFRQFTP